MNSTVFTYRLCNADDFDVWKDLNLAFMQEEIQDEDLWNNPDTEDVDTWKKTFEEALQSEDMIRLVLFEVDGVPVGFANIMIIYSVWTHGKAAVLDDLYLVPEIRGKSYGRQAMHFAEEIATKSNCKRLQFQSEGTNPNAKAFYQAIGFQPAEMNFYVKYFNG